LKKSRTSSKFFKIIFPRGRAFLPAPLPSGTGRSHSRPFPPAW